MKSCHCIYLFLKKRRVNILTKAKSEAYRRDFYSFVKDAYPKMGLGEYVDGWHIQLICKALEYLYENKIPSNSIYFNIPPSHGKSLLVSVFFPLWCWTKEPTLKFLLTAYADDRATQDSKRRRTLFTSEWYQTYFPLNLIEDTQARVTNERGGFFFASSLYGQIIGEHFSYIICDDILNGADRYSDAIINRMVDIYSNVLPSRFENPRTGKKIIICQRLSDKDIIGHINETKEPFEKIILPEMNDGVRYVSDFPLLNDPREEGELLWAERFDLPTVMKLQYSMSKQDIAGQYQQRPSPLAGAVFKKEWFINRFENTDIVWRFLFCDTAQTLKGDYTSILCAEVMSDYRIFIRNVFREKLEFPDLLKAIKRQVQEWQYNLHAVVIEGKSSGQSAIQLLRESADEQLANMIDEYIPKKSKEERAQLQTIWCEKGRIILPPPSAIYPWLLPFEEELFGFPNGKHDDQVDTFVMCLEYLESILADGFNATLPKQEMEDVWNDFRH